MKNQIEIIKKTRAFLLNIIKDLSINQLNEIPSGFNNNIIWNVAHLVAAQQGVCYARASLQMIVDNRYFITYKPDTKPEKFVSEAEVEQIKEMLVSTIEQFELDYQNNVFSAYVPWTTRYGAELNTIDEAIGFLFFHEGIHTGYVMALKRSLK